MRLSEITKKNSILVKDGIFDILAQCTINSQKKILTFLEDISYLDNINSNSSIGCVICKSEHVNLIENNSIGILCVERPKLYFFNVHNELFENNHYNSSRYNTDMGKNCSISPWACISSNNVLIGNNVIIEEYVSIRENVEIGDNCIIRTGSVIGGQGYEYKIDEQYGIIKVKHAGKTIIKNDVEIKELCTIHQAVFVWDYTYIGEHSKLDAHAHIGHATKIGKRVMIGSHGNLAGNVHVEDDVYIGPGVTISNRLNIGKKSRISIGSVVTKDVVEENIVTGNFAIDHNIFINDLKEKLKR